PQRLPVARDQPSATRPGPGEGRHRRGDRARPRVRVVSLPLPDRRSGIVSPAATVQTAARAAGVLDSKAPGGPLAERWTRHKFDLKLINPANRRKFHVIVVGTGLAGASAAASLA